MSLHDATELWLDAHYPDLVAWRRHMHAHPELGFEEVYTSARVAEMLKVCGVDSIHTGIGKTGVVALVHGQGRSASNPGRMIGLRADMDALPLTEFNECTWKSGTPGLMHGCQGPSWYCLWLYPYPQSSVDFANCGH